MVKTVILDGARTPFGNFGGALSSLRASELGGIAMKEALNRADVDPAGIDSEKVNVNGGAVALGHPIGASGARIILTLAYELKRRGGGIGIAAICSGSGQGDAIMIEVPGK